MVELLKKKDSDIPVLSYANQSMSLPQRLAILSMEHISGRGRLYRRYRQYRQHCQHVHERQAMWDLAVDTLGIHDSKQQYDLPTPRQGKGLLLFANHPYGIPDGILLAWIASRINADFRVIAINVLNAEPSLSPNILPIDFSDNRDATRQNISTRRSAIEHLCAGGVVAIFPAGAVSWARKRGAPVVDEVWQPMMGRLINASGCDALPIHFHGGNSQLYQFVSRHMMPIRQGLYLREVKKRLDQPINFSIGKMILHENLPSLSDRELSLSLRSEVYKLA